MDKEKLEEDIKAKRRENIDGLVTLTLKKMLEKDIRFTQSVHVYGRVLQIITETVKKLSFENKEILEARKAFLDVLIDGMQEHPFTIKDEIKEARKGIKSKDKEKKRKAVEILSHLERVRDNNPKDATEERDIECEPVCQEIAKTILSKEWLLKDKDYVKGVVELDDELMITVNAMSYANMLFEEIGYALEQSYSVANEKFWNEPKHKIRMSKLDKKLME